MNNLTKRAGTNPALSFMKHLRKLFILALLLLLPLNSVLALRGLPDCPPGTHGFWPDCVPDAPPTPDPVIVIPGITGSWNWQVLFHDSTNQPLDSWSFPPKADYYTPLIDALKAGFLESGLDPEKNVFIAFYDWRKSNAENYQTYLVPIIEQAKQTSGQEKVDIVAHSMGGILARAYIQGPNYQNDVDQLITLGTPHQGSSDVYTIWEGGHIPENWDPVQRYLFQAYFFLKGRDTVDRQRFETVRTLIPSVRDLLPTYNFLTATEFDNIFFPTNLMAEQNTLLASMNLNIDDLYVRAGNVMTIAGEGVGTVNNIPFVVPADSDAPLWKDGKPSPLDPAKNSSEGDNRVLLASAHLAGAATQTTIANANHADLPSLAAPNIFQELNMTDPGQLAITPIPDDIMAFMFASPVMPTVTDPNGNHITLDSNSIPGAEYFGEPDPTGLKMIIIPNPVDGEYKIDLLGNGNGHYDFASAFFKQDSPDSMQTFSGEVIEGQLITYHGTLNMEQENPLNTELVDQTPPTITITSPENGKAYRNDGTIRIDYTIEDESGIENRESRLDGQIVENDQVVDLSLLKLGNHALAVIATDAAGNSSQSTVAFSTFTNHAALKNNINHYLALKLIKTKGLAQALIGLVDAHKAAKTTKAKNAVLKAFEIAVQTAPKAKLIVQPAGSLLMEQIKAL